STFFSLFFFAALIAKKNLWHEIRNSAAYKDILIATLLLGIVYYVLVFIGLQYTSPGNASIISLTQIFFSFLFFHVFRREYIPTTHIWGGILMIFGAIIVLASNFQTFQGGDILILLANMIAPFGNFYAQRARKQVNSETIMFFRSALSSIFLFFLALLLHPSFSTNAIQDSLLFLLINGLLLLGLSKILWIEGIHRISVTKANALESIAPIFTLLFAWLLLQQLPTLWQLASLIPITAGVILLSKNHTKPQVTPVDD
ncbi:MAG TPA: DMT family transporter, partial [Patescibacteria group bacterium]|nr:DMT family transporter [Patescibacteria group bacterium]